MFKKKFKVRVRHTCSEFFVVEYAYYRFFKIWKALEETEFDEYAEAGECYEEKWFTIDEAEEMAASLKSIKDVNKYYAPYLEAREQYYREEREIYDSLPYTTKYFK